MLLKVRMWISICVVHILLVGLCTVGVIAGLSFLSSACMTFFFQHLGISMGVGGFLFSMILFTHVQEAHWVCNAKARQMVDELAELFHEEEEALKCILKRSSGSTSTRG